MIFINDKKESTPFTAITVAFGDGIGPEIMNVTLDILKQAKARIFVDTVEIGEAFYHKGYSSGISNEAWEVIKRNKVFLKSPITTPQGGGYKSLNVTIRRALQLYANVRPCVDYHPFVMRSSRGDIDLVIVRENQEDLYSGMEYRQSPSVYQCLKTVSIEGCTNIIRYAFEYAVKNKRKKVTCMTKNNIMKMSDGLFYDIFSSISKEYPDIVADHMIIDIGAAKLAVSPEKFDVVVTLNLYGDIVSDIVAEASGSVGLAGSSNIGSEYAMFEAIHGSAPNIVGQNAANPSGLLNGAIMMLSHIGQGSVAEKIQNALLYTIESGYHTPDVAINNPATKKILGTKEFAEEIINNLGRKPKALKPAPKYADFEFGDGRIEQKKEDKKYVQPVNIDRKLVGVDIFVNIPGNGKDVVSKVKHIVDETKFLLKFISFSGMQVYPGNDSGQFIGDNWRCRFVSNESINNASIIDLMRKIDESGIDCIKSENLYSFDGKNGFTLAQGE